MWGPSQGPVCLGHPQSSLTLLGKQGQYRIAGWGRICKCDSKAPSTGPDGAASTSSLLRRKTGVPLAGLGAPHQRPPTNRAGRGEGCSQTRTNFGHAILTPRSTPGLRKTLQGRPGLPIPTPNTCAHRAIPSIQSLGGRGLEGLPGTAPCPTASVLEKGRQHAPQGQPAAVRAAPQGRSSGSRSVPIGWHLPPLCPAAPAAPCSQLARGERAVTSDDYCPVHLGWQGAGGLREATASCCQPAVQPGVRAPIQPRQSCLNTESAPVRGGDTCSVLPTLQPVTFGAFPAHCPVSPLRSTPRAAPRCLALSSACTPQAWPVLREGLSHVLKEGPERWPKSHRVPEPRAWGLPRATPPRRGPLDP